MDETDVGNEEEGTFEHDPALDPGFSCTQDDSSHTCNGARPKTAVFLDNTSILSDVSLYGPQRTIKHTAKSRSPDEHDVSPAIQRNTPIFDDDLEDKYRCVYCSFPLVDPIQSYCGHRLCLKCKDQLFAEERVPRCPRCEDDGDEANDYSSLSSATLFPDRALEREMSRLIVKCFRTPDCSWVGKLKEFDVHYSSCDFRAELCQFGCGKHIRMNHQSEHDKENIAEHLQLLLMLIHSFHDNSHDKSKKMSEDLSVKLDYLGKEVATFKQSILKIADSNNNNSACADLRKRQDTFMSIIAVLDKEMKIIKREETEYQLQCEIDTDLIKGLKQKVDHLEKNVALKEISIQQNDQRIDELEMTTHGGTIVWPIKGYFRQKEAAKRGSSHSIYSPPFYTSRSGYKLRARIYLNGDGMGKNTHISLFLVLMRGPYDAILQWPFSQKVSLMILDQNNREHLVDSFRPDPSSSSFRRPVSDMNIASGCPLFAPQKKIEDKMFGYIKDDILFVKVTVE